MPTLSQQKPSKNHDGIKDLHRHGRDRSSQRGSQKLRGMFEKFETTDIDSAKQQLVAKICAALSVHAQIEEEIFYPAAREALKESDEDMIDEAEVEHDTIKQFVSDQMRQPTPNSTTPA